MKQLLDQCGSHMLLAMKDKAFLCLNVTTTTTNPNNPNTHHIMELLPPPPKIPQTLQDQKDEKSKKNNDTTNLPDGNPIQALSLLQFQKEEEIVLICAMTRFDKSLSLYSISLQNSNSWKDLKEQTPYWNYSTNKRCCSLAFTTLPSTSKSKVPIVITADLTGDVFAYPVLLPSKSTSSSYTLNPTEIDTNAKIQKRLLLGHTASMLTSVKISSDQNYLLTSDRDEKIRISKFPQTHILSNYLLGHSAFVSCMDVASDPTLTRCVSTSGDGTVRVWDYETAMELLCLDPLCPEEEDVNISTSHWIPSAVSISCDGSIIAIARDCSKQVQVCYLSPPQDNDRSKLEVRKNVYISCTGQPLSLQFDKSPSMGNDKSMGLYILTSDIENTLQYYQLPSSPSSTTEIHLSPIPTNTHSHTLQTHIHNSNRSSSLQMPSTVMEYKYNHPAHIGTNPKLKMIKKEDPVDKFTWNNSRERKEKDRLKQARIRKRKREQQRFEKEGFGG